MLHPSSCSLSNPFGLWPQQRTAIHILKFLKGQIMKQLTTLVISIIANAFIISVIKPLKMFPISNEYNLLYLPLIIYVSCMYFKHNILKFMLVTNTPLYHILCVEESSGYPISHSSLRSALWPWGSTWRVLLVWKGILSCLKDDVQKRKCHAASVVQGHIMCTAHLQYNPKNRKRC